MTVGVGSVKGLAFFSPLNVYMHRKCSGEKQWFYCTELVLFTARNFEISPSKTAANQIMHPTAHMPVACGRGLAGISGQKTQSVSARAGLLILIFHQNTNPFALGPQIGLDPDALGRDPQREHLLTYWYPKSLMDPTRIITEPTQTVSKQKRTQT